MILGEKFISWVGGLWEIEGKRGGEIILHLKSRFCAELDGKQISRYRRRILAHFNLRSL